MKKKICKICTTEISTAINSVLIKKLAGKELKDILENLCGLQLSNLEKCVFCQDCVLKLVQTEPFIAKVRKAFLDESPISSECTVNDEPNEPEANTAVQMEPTMPASFKCDVCDYQCKLGAIMAKHLENKHSLTHQKIYKCSICPQAYEFRGSLSRHISWGHGDKSRNFTCPQCNKSFFHEKVLAQHVLKHKETKASQSPKKNTSTDKVKANSITQKDDEVNNKDQTKVTPKKESAKKNISAKKALDNSTTQKVKKRLLNTTTSDNEDVEKVESVKKLSKHVEEQGDASGGGAKNTSNKAKRSFVEVTTFDSTLNDEDDENPELQNNKRKRLHCDTCDFTTTIAKKLAKHSKQHLHTDIIGNATNSTPKQLNNKIKKHEKSMAFNNLSKIAAYDMDTTSNERNNTCLICGKKFSDVEGLRSHMSKAHLSTENTCTNCGTNFNSTEKFQSHMASKKCKSYTYSCKMSQCNRLFENLNKMEKHFNKAHTNGHVDD